MSVLHPDVVAALDRGQISIIDLIRFDFPGRPPVGYHRGGRPYPYNGITYQPNRYLSSGEANSALGVAVTSREIVFSDIPSVTLGDEVAQLEQLEYVNAPVIITQLCGDPDTDQVLGILASNTYEIDNVRYERSAAEKDGTVRLTIIIELQPPGRSARGQTLIKRSTADHQFDNDPTDTGLEYVATVSTIPEEWGQVSR